MAMRKIKCVARVSIRSERYIMPNSIPFPPVTAPSFTTSNFTSTKDKTISWSCTTEGNSFSDPFLFTKWYEDGSILSGKSLE